MRTRSALLWAIALLLTPSSGCDEPPPPPPPPMAKPAPPPAAPPTTAEAPPTTAEAPPTTAEAPPTKAEAPTEALPVDNKTTRRSRLLAHYRALRCLTSKGADTEEIAAAFTASGLSPAAWEQALGELLDAMAASPNGDVAQALRSANARPCSQGGGP